MAKIYCTVESDKSDRTTIYSSFRIFVLVNKLHGPMLWRAAQSAGRESVGYHIQSVFVFAQLAAHFRNEVNYVTEILHFLEFVHFYIIATAVQVVSCQIDQHSVFSVFLRIVE